jgi:[ribosomal protein S5]-alanine N-acetyltransferase
MELFTPRLTLREFRLDDFASFRELETHPSTNHYETTCPDESAIRKYLESAQSDALQTPRVRYRFAVVLLDDKVHGRVTLTLINASIREWEIGWAIHPDLWGAGIATEAAHRLLEFAFHELHSHRVVAFSHAKNLASIRVMKKLEMQQDGHLRETRRWQDGWADEVVFSLLEREFER